ncbi:MAG: hypothetical protein WBG46_05530 [Nonlabens sp.]
MDRLKEIYVKYEIGEIYPENLPFEIQKLPGSALKNEFLIKISNLNKPTKQDLYEYILNAFSIPEDKKITQMEKIEILINWWENGKINSEKLLFRLRNLCIQKCISNENLDNFERKLQWSINGEWVPSDEWDDCIEELKKVIILNL